jgi:hypothetical protein
MVAVVYMCVLGEGGPAWGEAKPVGAFPGTAPWSAPNNCNWATSIRNPCPHMHVSGSSLLTVWMEGWPK